MKNYECLKNSKIINFVKPGTINMKKVKVGNKIQNSIQKLDNLSNALSGAKVIFWYENKSFFKILIDMNWYSRVLGVDL